MEIEFEATFVNIDKDEMRARLVGAGAVLVRKEYLQKRITFNPPESSGIKNGWLRVRDEGDKITMSLKIVDGNRIDNQKETLVGVSDFKRATEFISSLGCKEKSYQESKRELWDLDGVEVMIDEWPFLPPFVEIEGKNEDHVRVASHKLGFDYGLARFCAVSALYSEKYGISEERINNETPRIVFDMDNPFIDKS